MLSYHNDENLKKLVVAEMKNHKVQDQFVKGRYSNYEKGSKFKGCAVGCTIDSLNLVLNKSYDIDEHSVFEEAIGVPGWLARLQDKIFEGLTDNENSQFAVDFLDSIPVGVNLEPVKWKFCSFILKECIDRILYQPNLSDELREKVIKSIRDVLNFHESAISTGIWDAEAAESAARSAAWSAESAARSAESAARSAAWSASSAARSASSAAWSAESAARSAAWSASSAESAAYKRYSVELIRLLKESKGEV